MKYLILFFAILIIASCNNIKGINADEEKTNVSEDIDLSDTTYFNLVKEYIYKNGKIDSVNISSRIDSEMIIEYRIITIDNWQFTIDHSNRIYMNCYNLHYGNILKEDSIVRPEINYGVPDKDPQLTKEKKDLVLEKYRMLIGIAIK